MTKIANKTVAYKIKSPIVGTDYFPITNSEHNVQGSSFEQTKSADFNGIKAFILGSLTPIQGGQLKTTEIDITTLDTDVSTTVNAISPAYAIDPYEVVYFVIEGEIYVCKVSNQTIGSGETALSNSDFIHFPVSVGPAGADGNGIATISKINTTGLVDTYSILFTDSTSFVYTVTNGANGTNGTNGSAGSVWRNGSGAPSNSLGANGDYYLNVTNGDVYLKATGTYTVQANIKGADGSFVNVQDLTKTTSFVLQASDNAKTFYVDNGASDITITVPSGLPSAFFCSVVRQGSGNITITPSGTTINNPIGLKIDSQYDVVVLEQVGSTNVYGLFGNTKA